MDRTTLDRDSLGERTTETISRHPLRDWGVSRPAATRHRTDRLLFSTISGGG